MGQLHVSDSVAHSGKSAHSGEVNDLVTGRSVDAAHGINPLMKVPNDWQCPSIVQAQLAMFHEFESKGTAIDRECLHYVMEERAGASVRSFQGGLLRDCDPSGRVYEDRLTEEGRQRLRRGLDVPADSYGMTLADFINHPDARAARLEAPHVIALRVYTTAAYQTINTPLRDQDPSRAPHPFPVTVTYLQDAIKKLRAVEANRQHDDAGDSSSSLDCQNSANPSSPKKPRGKKAPKGGDHEESQDFFRGLRNLTYTGSFMKNGGTELAPMSTSSDLSVALRYSLAEHSLLLKIKTSDFMNRGVAIQFLSAFPAEKEYLYPPLTYLKPTGKTINVSKNGLRFTVVEVKPAMG